MRYYTAGVFAIGPARNLRGAFWRHTTRAFRTCASLEFELQVCENPVKDIRNPASGRKREKHHPGTKTHLMRVYTVCHDPYVREYLTASSSSAIVLAGPSQWIKVGSNCIRRDMLLSTPSRRVHCGNQKATFYFTQTRSFTFPCVLFLPELTLVSRDQVYWNGYQISTWMDLCPCGLYHVDDRAPGSFSSRLLA
jgi:hypothetical protein